MTIAKTHLHIGLDRPMTVLHVTDTHMTLCDGRDDERKQNLAARRAKDFGSEHGEIEAMLEGQLAYAKERGALVVHTGDLMDFVSKANVDRAREILRRPDVFFVPGNHDYSQYVGEAWEDEAYRMNSYMQMGYGLGVDMFFSSRIVGGVNFVGIDDGYYRIAPWQLERLRMEVEKGLPVILCLHDPLFEQSLYDMMMSKPVLDCAYVVGCDEAHLLPYSEYRAYQQRPDEATLRAIDYIKGEKRIKALLTGHLHAGFECMLTDTLPQFVTGPGYRDMAREITID